MREEGGEWSDGDDLIHLNKDEDYIVVYPLKAATEYDFRIMGKQNGLDTKWSEVLSVKTNARLVIPYIEDAISRLRRNINSADECVALIKDLNSLTNEGNKELFNFYLKCIKIYS